MNPVIVISCVMLCLSGFMLGLFDVSEFTTTEMELK